MATPRFAEIHGIEFAISYAGSATTFELSSWMWYAKRLQPGQVMICISGDDSVLAVGNEHGTDFYAGDFNSFDQSQSFGPLAYGRDVMSHLGVPGEANEVLDNMSKATYVITSVTEDGVMSVDRSKNPQRDSGGPDTSLANGIITGSSNVAVVVTRLNLTLAPVVQRKEFEKGFLELGFKITYEEVHAWNEVTFLKGMFYEGRSGEAVWSVLPSRVIKACKALHDPRQYFQLEGLPRYLPDGSPNPERYTVAVKSMLASMAANYAHFPEVPLLSAYVKAFASLPKREEKGFNPEVWGRFHAPWRVQNISASELAEKHRNSPLLVGGEWDSQILQNEARLVLCKRYGVSPALFRETEQALADVVLTDGESVFLRSPLYEAMVMADYG